MVAVIPLSDASRRPAHFPFITILLIVANGFVFLFILAAVLIGVWFLIQLFSVGSVATVQTGGVAYLAHIGGFVFGVAAARLLLDRQRIAEQT